MPCATACADTKCVERARGRRRGAMEAAGCGRSGRGGVHLQATGCGHPASSWPGGRTPEVWAPCKQLAGRVRVKNNAWWARACEPVPPRRPSALAF
eukprot:359140-Chlamydomonas_euryale.AAC.2